MPPFLKGNVMEYGIFKDSVVTIYEGPYETVEKNGQVLSAIADEGLHGMAVLVTGEEENGFLPVQTHYGYFGYVRKETLQPVTGAEIKAYEASDLKVIDTFYADVVSVPKVQGVPLISLPRGSVIKVLEYASGVCGWGKVELADGRVGYMRNQFFAPKKFSMSALWLKMLPQRDITDEAKFRDDVVDTALKYLGTQYRWGGKSSLGIDCSGLTSMSYMLNGILTYRDAKIVQGFPVHEIPRAEMKKGDLLYFPGHIAMYIGGDRYVHSTGKIGSGGVVINSLNPAHVDYREDLDKELYAVGSIFA